MTPRIIVFDLEVRRSKDEVGGWDALRRGEGGISALAAWDSLDNWVQLYDDTNPVDAAEHLEQADILVGYASSTFDQPCLEGHIDRKLRTREHYDIYADIKRALFERDGREFQKGYKLNEICLRCLGEGKTEHGAHAPQLASEGQWARLFRYCMHDVRLTRDLLHYIIREDGIIDANGRFLRLDVPACLRPNAAPVVLNASH